MPGQASRPRRLTCGLNYGCVCWREGPPVERHTPLPKLPTLITHCHVANNFRKTEKWGGKRAPLLFCQCQFLGAVTRIVRAGLTRRRRSGGWTLNFLRRQETGSRQAMSWQRRAKINSGAEESIQHGCQRTVKLPSMMDSLDVHSLFAARLRSSE